MVKMTVGTLYNNTKAIFKISGIENYSQEAFYIIEKATGIKKHELPIKEKMPADQSLIDEVNSLVVRRKSGEPLQYILGEWEFYSLNFKVGEGVLIPRQDTETLVDFALEELKGKSEPVVADLCSGSGCIAISIEKNCENSKVFAVELSDMAIPYLQININENDSSVKIIKGNVCDEKILNNLPQLDMIVSNPPYLTAEDMKSLQKEVTYEPCMALDGGEDGLHFYRAITSLWKDKLKENGVLAFECGINQHNQIKEILEENGFKNICFKEDLCGIIRVVAGYKE